MTSTPKSTQQPNHFHTSANVPMAVENRWPREFDHSSDLWLLQKPMIKTKFLLRITMKETKGGYDT